MQKLHPRSGQEHSGMRWYLNPVSRGVPRFLFPVKSRPVKSRGISIPSRAIPSNLNPVQIFPFNSVMVQSRPAPTRVIKNTSYVVPGNSGISRSRGIPSRDKTLVPRNALFFSNFNLDTSCCTVSPTKLQRYCQLRFFFFSWTRLTSEKDEECFWPQLHKQNKRCS